MQWFNNSILLGMSRVKTANPPPGYDKVAYVGVIPIPAISGVEKRQYGI